MKQIFYIWFDLQLHFIYYYGVYNKRMICLYQNQGKTTSPSGLHLLKTKDTFVDYYFRYKNNSLNSPINLSFISPSSSGGSFPLLCHLYSNQIMYFGWLISFIKTNAIFILAYLDDMELPFSLCGLFFSFGTILLYSVGYFHWFIVFLSPFNKNQN